MLKANEYEESRKAWNCNITLPAVELHGLQSAAAAVLNGSFGFRGSYNRERGRYVIFVEGGAGKLIKPANFTQLTDITLT